MPERPHTTPEPIPDRRPAYDLSTIMGIPIGEVQVLPEVEAMAANYLAQLKKERFGLGIWSWIKIWSLELDLEL